MSATQPFFFYLFANCMVLCSLAVIVLRNPLSSAFFLVLSFLGLAGLYVMLDAHFIAASQILVYAGAVMVLFIFVIMLLNFGHERWGFLDHRHPMQTVAVVLGVAAVVALASVTLEAKFTTAAPQVSSDFGQIATVARWMFSKYFVAFELVSVLLLVAIVGAVLLAKRVV